MERISLSGPAGRFESPASRVPRPSRWQGQRALAAALLLGACPLAHALDPALPLRQMVVDTWQAADGLPQNSSTAIVQTEEGYVWIATEEGLARFDGVRFEVHDRERVPELGSNTVNVLCEGRDGTLWIGTNGGGLAKLSGGRFRIFGRSDGLPMATVLCVREDRDGTVWAGTNGGGLCRLAGDRFECLTSRDGLPGDLVWTLAEDREGGLWVGTSGGGIGRLRAGRFLTWGKKEGLSSDVVLPVLEDAAGAVWAGTAGGGLDRLEPSTGRVTVFGLREGLPHAVVLSLARSPSGDLWIGTAGGGLTRHDGRRFVTLTTRDGLGSDLVHSIFVAPDGSVWAGTQDGGLCRIAGGRVTAIRKKDGLFDDLVGAIVEDATGNFWMTCNKGVYRARRSDLEAFARGSARWVSCVSYGRRDGLRTAECNGGFTPSAWRASDGRLWFPTGRGLSVVDPARLHDGGPPPPVIVEALLVDGRTADVGRTVAVKAGSRNLEIRFTAPSFADPHAVGFRYQLEGFDEEWVEAGTRRVAWYTNVPPGDYRFRVAARHANGAWNQETASLALSVAARFHRSAPFYALCLACAGATAFAALAVRRRKRRSQEEERVRARTLLEKLVAERTVQLKAANEALEAFSYSVSHDLRAPLRTMDGFSRILLEEHAENLDPEGKRCLERVREGASRMSALIEDLLRFSRVGSQRLRPERVDMTALARSAWDELVAQSAGPPVDFHLDPLPEAFADASLLRQVWLNLLSNALKFTSKRTRRTVCVRGRSEAGQTVYEVEDDGVGFEMESAARLFGVFERLRGSREVEGTGVGLSLVKRIVEHHGGAVSARGQAGAGATFSFTLPEGPLVPPTSASRLPRTPAPASAPGESPRLPPRASS